MSDNILSRIPGDILGSACTQLPNAETAHANTQQMILRLPDGTRAKVSFVKLSSKKGRSTRWFWTPESAVILE